MSTYYSGLLFDFLITVQVLSTHRLQPLQANNTHRWSLFTSLEWGAFRRIMAIVRVGMVGQVFVLILLQWWYIPSPLSYGFWLVRGSVLGPIGGLSARQLNSCLPRREEKRIEILIRSVFVLFILVYYLTPLGQLARCCLFAVLWENDYGCHERCR